MKILFWTDGFWPRLGGIETQGFEFIKAMQERGHEFRVVAHLDQGLKREEIYRNIPIRRFDFSAIIEKRDLSLFQSIQTYLESIQPDIIHLNATSGGSSFAFSIFQKMFRAPQIATIHAPAVYENTFAPIIKKILSTVDQICCVSNWVLGEMEKHLPLLKSKMQMIYNGLPMPQIVPSPLSFSPPTLLLFGRIVKEKGFDTALHAFSHLLKGIPDAKLVIAGGGPLKPSLEKLALELSLSASVTFTGVLNEEEVLANYNRASLVIVPSLIESFGLVILESMQMGRPVIASRVEGVPEVVVEGVTGLLIPPSDPHALCQAIESLIKNPAIAIEMGIQGRQRASKRFTIEQNANQYEELYKRLRK
jgi:glycogen(starch) synthase